jgi:hypothetical protein
MMQIDGKARKINCATDWKDLSAYEDFLVRRYTQPVLPNRIP